MTLLENVQAWWLTRPFLGSLLIMMILDIVLGIIRAVQDRRLSSDVSGRGMRRKATMLVLVMVGLVLGRVANAEGIGEAIALFFMVSELLSIIENAGLLGVPIPPPLAALLVQLRAQTGNDGPTFRLGDSPQEHERILQERVLADKNAPRPDPVNGLLDGVDKGHLE